VLNTANNPLKNINNNKQVVKNKVADIKKRKVLKKSGYIIQKIEPLTGRSVSGHHIDDETKDNKEKGDVKVNHVLSC
jgi:hypothetical protein